MSGGWWQENNPNPAEMRQLIQHLQSELARAHQELAVLRGQRQQINSPHMHQASRFRFIPDSLTWYEHDANARRMGGHLATIHSGAENREVQAAARGQTIWIGGLRHSHRNGHGVDTWRWSSESDGFSSTGMLVSPIIPVGMKMQCKCTATENGTMCAKIGKDLRCMNFLTPIEETSVFTLPNRPQYNR